MFLLFLHQFCIKHLNLTRQNILNQKESFGQFETGYYEYKIDVENINIYKGFSDISLPPFEEF